MAQQMREVVAKMMPMDAMMMVMVLMVVWLCGEVFEEAGGGGWRECDGFCVAGECGLHGLGCSCGGLGLGCGAASAAGGVDADASEEAGGVDAEGVCGGAEALAFGAGFADGYCAHGLLCAFWHLLRKIYCHVALLSTIFYCHLAHLFFIGTDFRLAKVPCGTYNGGRHV